MRRGIGLAVYIEKTGLGPFETTQVEARADGTFVVDTGASSMGPGLETVLAQILGEHLGVPPARFNVRHADTKAVESGVGTYGSRGTVTAGNAAALAAAKLIGGGAVARGRALGVAEDDVTYDRRRAVGARPQRDARRPGGGEDARRRRVVRGPEDHLRRLRVRGRPRRGHRDRRARRCAGSWRARTSAAR